jgi:hypothetical protein
LHESKDPNAQRKVDYPSVVFGFAGIALVVLGISQSETWGWTDTKTLGSIGLGLFLVALFVQRCRVVTSPLLDLKLFRLPFVLAANLSGLLFGIGFIGMWLLNTFWLQAVWGYSVAHSGLAAMPGPFMAALVAPFAGKYANKFGHARSLQVQSCSVSARLVSMHLFPLNPIISCTTCHGCFSPGLVSA